MSKMRIRVSFGIDRSDYVQDFILLGARWCFDGGDNWFEFHLLGFRFFFISDE